MSASRASPGPLTTQPITATVKGTRRSDSSVCTLWAMARTSMLVRPQVGQLTTLTYSVRRPTARRMSMAAAASGSGSPVRETRTVSPMPCNSSAPMPTALLMCPAPGSPASVTPR